MRTGQAHRTLHGHTGPITCLQFDEIHIASGSLDKTLRVSLTTSFVWTYFSYTSPSLPQIWDLRTGETFETIKYDHAVTAVQFDTRKIVAAAGKNSVMVTSNQRPTRWQSCLIYMVVQIYNRTSMQQSALVTNGHTRPVEKLRYMDRYLVTGGRDSTVKIWSL